MSSGKRSGGATGSGGSGGSGSRSGKAREQPSSPLREWTRSILAAVVIYIVIRTFLVQTFVITSGSMETTLQVGDMLVVNRAALGSRIPVLGVRTPGYSKPHRGEIMVFEPPPPDTVVKTKLVKRLVGMPGDTLQMRGGVLYLDGQAVQEPYVTHSDEPDVTHPWMEWQKEYLLDTVDPGTYSPTRDYWGPLVIPEGRYFMMGDNRENSVDSRYWGLVERWRLEGSPAFVYFSYNRESYRPFPWLREIRWGRIGRLPD